MTLNMQILFITPLFFGLWGPCATATDLPSTSGTLVEEVLSRSSTPHQWDWRNDVLMIEGGYTALHEFNSFESRSYNLGLATSLGGPWIARGAFRKVVIQGTPSSEQFALTPFSQAAQPSRYEALAGAGYALIEGRSMTALSPQLTDVGHALYAVVGVQYNFFANHDPEPLPGMRAVYYDLVAEAGLRFQSSFRRPWALDWSGLLPTSHLPRSRFDFLATRIWKLVMVIWTIATISFYYLSASATIEDLKEGREALGRDNPAAALKAYKSIGPGDPLWTDKLEDLIRYSLIKEDGLEAWRVIQIGRRTRAKPALWNDYERLALLRAQACPLAISANDQTRGFLLNAAVYRLRAEMFEEGGGDLLASGRAVDVSHLTVRLVPYLAEIPHTELLPGRGSDWLSFRVVIARVRSCRNWRITLLKVDRTT